MATQIFSRVRGCNGAFDWSLQVLNAQWEGQDWQTGLLRSIQTLILAVLCSEFSITLRLLRTFSGCFCSRGLYLHQGHQVESG